MEESCSFFGIKEISCGDDRGQKGVVNLLDCTEDVSDHLSSCHLSKSGLTESQLILARSGLFDISPEVMKTMTVCSNHRVKLGRFWRPLRSCQYPAHSGPLHQYKSRSVINVRLSMEINKLYGILVQIGSRKYASLGCSFINKSSIRLFVSSLIPWFLRLFIHYQQARSKGDIIGGTQSD